MLVLNHLTEQENHYNTPPTPPKSNPINTRNYFNCYRFMKHPLHLLSLLLVPRVTMFGCNQKVSFHVLNTMQAANSFKKKAKGKSAELDKKSKEMIGNLKS